MRQLLILVGVLLAAVTTARAAPAAKPAAPAPPAAPAAPTNGAPDLSTPTKAARAFSLAMESGDMDAVRAVSVAPPDYYKWMAQTVRTAAAARRLEDAAVAQFGKDGRGVGSPAAPVSSAVLDESNLVEKIDGDSATLGPKDEPVFKFRRANGAWKLDLAATMPGLDQAGADRVAVEQKKVEQVLNNGAAWIKAGKFKDADDAHSMIQDALALVLRPPKATDAAGAAPREASKATPAPRPAAPPAGADVVAIPQMVDVPPPEQPANPSKRIVFLCSGAGSMAKKMPVLKLEMGKAVAGLTPDQKFNLIFFQDGKAVAFQQADLVAATPENKKLCTAFLDKVTARGNDDPLPALALAFRQKPELIYFLSGGDFPDDNAVLKKVRELDKPVGGKVPVKMNPIAFVEGDDKDTEFLQVLERMAKESGGTFRHVAVNELEN